MRALHLFFQIHHPYKMNLDNGVDFFAGAASFQKADQQEYQPLFAILERNSQKFSDFKVSLSLTESWIRQAEKWDPELLRRIERLVKNGTVELLAGTIFHSLASFYNVDEFAAQMQKSSDILRQNFGSNSKVLAMPELMYHDRLAKWAGKMGFDGFLIGGAKSALDFRNANQVFEAKNCENIKILCENEFFSRMLSFGTNDIFSSEKCNAGNERNVFSSEKFKRQLDLAFLHGKVVNICLDSGIFGAFRQNGIVKFFDEIIAKWLHSSNNRFLTATEIIRSIAPTAELSVKVTSSRRGYDEIASGVEATDKLCYQVPDFLNGKEQKRLEEQLYNLRDYVLKTKDEALRQSFMRLTSLDFLIGLERNAPRVFKGQQEKGLEIAEFEQILRDLQRETFKKMPEPLRLEAEAKIEQAVAPPAEDFSVKVKRIPKQPQVPMADDALDDEEEAEILAVEKLLARRQTELNNQLGGPIEAEVIPN